MAKIAHKGYIYRMLEGGLDLTAPISRKPDPRQLDALRIHQVARREFEL